MNAETKTYIVTMGSDNGLIIVFVLDGPVGLDIIELFIEYCSHYGLDLPEWIDNPRFERTNRTFGETLKIAKAAIERVKQDNLIDSRLFPSDWGLYLDAFKAWLIRDKGFSESTAEEVFLGD